ncbi:MAG: 5'-nucleotidase [Alphaproteobacteria bacterium]|nr:5'-nucleotidase [Alphaproteobacteria bacterium]
MSEENFKPLIIGVSARALFDMREESELFKTKGEEEYRAFQIQNLKTPLKPGTVFQLIQKLMTLNEPGKAPRVELVLITKNSAEAGHRVYESIRHYGLEIPRAIMTKGEFEPEVLKAFNIDLFLSRNDNNVMDLLKAGIAAAQVYDPPANYDNKKPGVHFAFDGDKVLFGGISEDVFLAYGLDTFVYHEKALRDSPLEFGPFAKLLFKLNDLKKTYPADQCPIKISLVTARGEIRVLNTLHLWGDQYVDAAYMLGNGDEKGSVLQKAPLLKAIGADIFFDDSKRHTDLSADVLPTGYVPDVQPHQPLPSLTDIMNLAATKDKKKPGQKQKKRKKKTEKKPKP